MRDHELWEDPMSPRSKNVTTKQKKRISIGKKTSPAKGKAPAKVFISYAHRDEKYKNELLTMLAGLENQKIIKVWQDRRIDPGEEWYKAIRNAMKTCQLALLLVSQHFLASPFIQSEELPTLLKQRIHEGLTVIPIIIRPCMWRRDPILKGLQSLPKDAKPVASVSSPNKRDQIWADIAEAIEKRVK